MTQASAERPSTIPRPASPPPAWNRQPPGDGRRWRAEGRETAVAGPIPRGGRRPVAVGPQRVLFVNQYYWPSHASTAQHLADLAEAMAVQGYECHVLCSRVGPGQADCPAREVRNGVQIH